MSGQRGGFRDAVARFTAEVQDAVTNARRAAAEAHERSAQFRRGTEELRAKAAPVRNAPAPDPEPEDEDFSQHRLLDDDPPREPSESAEDSVADGPESVHPSTESPVDTDPEDPHTGDEEDFSQQRILVDAAPESYRPEALPAIGSDLREADNPS